MKNCYLEKYDYGEYKCDKCGSPEIKVHAEDYEELKKRVGQADRQIEVLRGALNAALDGEGDIELILVNALAKANEIQEEEARDE